MCPQSGLGGVQPPLTLFKFKGILSDTLFERPLRQEYNAVFVS
jgi:hypothetical protein